MTLAPIDADTPDAAHRAVCRPRPRWLVRCSSTSPAELPALARRIERDRLLLATWLLGLRSPRTRRAYLGDVAGWLDWLAERDVDMLAAQRVHADLWVSVQLLAGAADSSIRVVGHCSIRIFGR